MARSDGEGGFLLTRLERRNLRRVRDECRIAGHLLHGSEHRKDHGKVRDHRLDREGVRRCQRKRTS